MTDRSKRAIFFCQFIDINDLPSGERCDLGETKKVFSGIGYTEEPGEVYLYRFLIDFYEQDHR